MAAYSVDDDEFLKTIPDSPDWIMPLVIHKISQIRDLNDPRAVGGAYRDYWAYPTGKIHLLANIDDTNKIVKLVKIIKLP